MTGFRTKFHGELVIPLAVRKNWGDIQARRLEMEASQWWEPDAIEQHQLALLKTLLSSAVQNSPFYRSLYQDHGDVLDSLEALSDLKSLPYLTKEGVAELRDVTAMPPGGIKRLTAGTSGIPAIVYAPSDTWTRSLAARYRFQGWYGIEVGDAEARFWGRNPFSRIRNYLKSRALNRIVFHTDDLNGERFPKSLAAFRRFSPGYFYGYSSMVRKFVLDADALGFDFSPYGLKGAVLTSESSTALQRDRMAGILDCPVFQEYGCSEVDIIAFECPEGGLHINAENILVEEVPVQGADGLHELVVTDLRNMAMPIIRYRLGDLGRLSADRCSCGRGLPVIESLQGRHQGQFIHTPDGQKIHSGSFAYVFETHLDWGNAVDRFFIYQETVNDILVEIALHRADPELEGIIRSAVLEHSLAVLGETVVCDVRFTDRIRHQQAGKYSYFETSVDKGGSS